MSDKIMGKVNSKTMVFTFLQAAKLFAENPPLMVYGIISFGLTLLIFIGMIFALIFSTELIIDSLFSWLNIENWGFWAKLITYPGLIVGYGLFAFFTFVAVAGIISIPFMDMMSEKIEQIIRPHHENSGFWFGLKHGFISSIIVLFRMLVVMTVSLPFLLIPLLGTVVYFLINSWYIGFSFLDIPMGRRGWTFKEKKFFLQNYKYSQLWFGIIINTLTMIPVFNLLIIPWATATGTLIFIEIREGNES